HPPEHDSLCRRSWRSLETLPRRRWRGPRPAFLATCPSPLRSLSFPHRRKALGGRRAGKEEGIWVLNRCIRKEFMDRQSTVLPRLTAFGVKFGYLFGVTAATLILVSWIVSNTLLDSAKAARERMQNILSAQRDFHRFSIVSQHLRNFEKQLTRIENVVHSSTEGQVPEHAQRLTDAISYLHWTQVYWADVNDLIEFTFEIERLSKPVSVGDKFKTELKAISTEIWNIQERFQTLRKDYEANQIKLLGQDGISMERTTHEQVDSLQPLIMEYWQSVRK